MNNLEDEQVLTNFDFCYLRIHQSLHKGAIIALSSCLFAKWSFEQLD